MEENEIYELFGLENTGAEEMEPAEPSEETGLAEGENSQDFAEPEHESEEAEGAEEEASLPETQPPEERARYAAARRKAEAERDAAVARARQEAQQAAQRQVDEFIRQSGMTDPYTGKPITTKAEYDAYRQRFESERKAEVMRKSGMSDEQFRQFVQALPEVREAQQAKQAAEDAARQAREQQARVRVDEQIREIAKLDPSITKLEDLQRMESYPRFYELVKKGNTLVDAFWLANREQLQQSTAEASRQAARNSAQSKQHMATTTSRGAGSVPVPAEVKAAYRELNPNATDAEISKHYNAYLRRK